MGLVEGEGDGEDGAEAVGACGVDRTGSFSELQAIAKVLTNRKVATFITPGGRNFHADAGDPVEPRLLGEVSPPSD